MLGTSGWGDPSVAPGTDPRRTPLDRAEQAQDSIRARARASEMAMWRRRRRIGPDGREHTVPRHAEPRETGDDRVAGMQEQRIETDGVPARLYEPEGARGLLLLGHGGASSKDEPRFVELGRRYAEGTGLAVVCIDVVGHGERTETSAPAPRPDQVMAWIIEKVEQTVSDWRATAGALSSIGPPVAYAGFSMGMLFGAPTVVAIPEIRAVVFGVGGVPVALGDGSVLTDYAARLGDRQVLMLNMTLDALFPPAGALEFFGAIPGRRKRIMFWEGDHLGLPAESIRHSVAFIARHAVGD